MPSPSQCFLLLFRPRFLFPNLSKSTVLLILLHPNLQTTAKIPYQPHPSPLPHRDFLLIRTTAYEFTTLLTCYVLSFYPYLYFAKDPMSSPPLRFSPLSSPSAFSKIFSFREGLLIRTTQSFPSLLIIINPPLLSFSDSFHAWFSPHFFWGPLTLPRIFPSIFQEPLSLFYFPS